MALAPATVEALLGDQKRRLVEHLIDLCPFLTVDGTQEGCVLPAGYARADLVLRLGRNKAVIGIPDLELDLRGFRGSLMFSGVLFKVYVPWAAVSRLWCGDPFIGPLVVFPTLQPVEKPPAGRPDLHVVRPS